MASAKGRAVRKPAEDAEGRALTRRVQLLINEGGRLLAAGQARASLPFLEEAYRMAPQEGAACINLGGAYILLGRYREAIPILESAADLEPENPMVWVNLAAAYLGNPVLATSEQQQRALNALRRSVELNPATPNAYYNLGLIYKDRGEWEQARDAFAWAVKVNPGDRDASLWLKRIEELTAGYQEDDA